MMTPEQRQQHLAEIHDYINLKRRHWQKISKADPPWVEVILPIEEYRENIERFERLLAEVEWLEKLQDALEEIANWQGAVVIGFSSPEDNEQSQNTVYEIVNIALKALGRDEIPIDWPILTARNEARERSVKDGLEVIERAKKLLQEREG